MVSRSVSQRLIVSLFFVIFVSALAVHTIAQSTRQKVALQGTILDPSRAAVPGSSVVAENYDSLSPALSTITDQNGEFSFSLAPGKYRIKALAEGFAAAVQNVNLESDKPTTVEILLEIAESSATVTITDTAGYLTDTISSATRTLTPLRDVPQSITVVSKDQIKDQLMQSITDVVTYIPGITAHQGENNRDQLILRGNSTSADFFLNGVRDDVQYYRDLYNVDRIEALKGPNSMTFGRGGGGGVVNRVTKEAGFSALREFTFQGGSFQNKRVTADFDQPLNDKVALRFNGLYENSGSFRDFVDLERYGINPTLTFVPSANTRFTLNYEHFHDGRTADRGIPSFQLRPADTPISSFFGDPNNSHVRARVDLLSANIEHHVGNFSINNRTLFGDYDRGYQNYVPGAVTADKSKVALSAYNNATKRENLFNQTDATYQFSTASIRHHLLGGAELGRQLTDNFRNTGFFNSTATSILVPYNNPTINTPITFRQSATDADNHLKTNLAAGYVQDQIELSRKFQVVTGVRFDYFDLTYLNNRNGQELRRIDRLVSPRTGVIFKPITAISLYGNYSVAYLPSAGDQFSSLTTITQQVKPEKFTNYEAGAKWDVRRNLFLTTALYRQDRTNTRANDPNDPTRIVQTGSQRTNGFELGLSGNVTRKWVMAGGYAFQNAFVTSDTTAARAGAQVAQVPHHTFSLWNNYKIINRLGVGLGIVHRADMFAAIDNTVVLPGYTRADAAVFFFISEKWRLQANFQNLFDKKYYQNADNNNNISPGSPRGARVALVARF
jgi:catecholate siderophore receptor